MSGISVPRRAARPTLDRRAVGRLLALVALVATAAALAGVVFLSPKTETAATKLPVRGVTQQIYPATLGAQLNPPADQSWTLPVAAVPLDGSTFVLDAGNARIMKFDANGDLAAKFDATTDARLALKEPMAMVTDGTSLYIANSLVSQVVVVDPASGRVLRVVTVPALSGREKAPRLIGLALLANGQMAVSDGDNHRVLIIDGSGQVLRTVGTGNRASGKDGFNVPAAITTDAAGNLYVVDTLNGRVVELSPDGKYVGEFGKYGATAGSLQRPKGVAVDASGRVFISDGLGSVVDVYAADGSYLGMIGRATPSDPASTSLFRAPAGLTLAGDTLYVADRIAGIVVFKLGAKKMATGPAAKE